jgi:hypothetical protein
MYNKPQQGYRVDVNRLRDEKIRQSYSITLAKNMEDIDPTCNLEVHANKIRQAIQNTVEKTVPAKRKTKKTLDF